MVQSAFAEQKRYSKNLKKIGNKEMSKKDIAKLLLELFMENKK